MGGRHRDEVAELANRANALRAAIARAQFELKEASAAERAISERLEALRTESDAAPVEEAAPPAPTKPKEAEPTLRIPMHHLAPREAWKVALAGAAAATLFGALAMTVHHEMTTTPTKTTPTVQLIAQPIGQPVQPTTVDPVAPPPPIVARPQRPITIPPTATPPPSEEKGFVTLASYPWAKVTEGGKVICPVTPCARVAMSPGTHTVTFENSDQNIKQTSVVVIMAGQTTSINRSLSNTASPAAPPRSTAMPSSRADDLLSAAMNGGPPSTAPAPTGTFIGPPLPPTAPGAASQRPAGFGALTVVCLPKCDQIMDNGTPLGGGHIFNRPVPSGRHSVTLSAPNGVKKTLQVDVMPNQTREIRVSMEGSFKVSYGDPGY